MILLFSSFLFIISKFYISTIIVKIQLNDNKFKNINLLFTTQYILFTYQVMSCHIHDCYSVDARRWQSVEKLRNNQTCCLEDSFRRNRCWRNCKIPACKKRKPWIFIGIIFSPRKRISYWHLTVFELLHRLKNFQSLDVGGGISTALSLEIQFKHTFNSSIL